MFTCSHASAYKNVFCADFVQLFAMASVSGSIVLTISDLRGRVDTNWEQDIRLPIRFRVGPPLDVRLAEGTVLPMAMFEYQLERAVYDGTAAGGVKWWFHKRFEPQGSQRLPAAEAKMKRKGKKQKGRASKAKEASAPPKMIKQAASARAGSAARPISIGSSSCSNRSSDDGDESDSSTNDSQSDIGEYGFRHGADVGDQYAFSENDSYDSDYDYREM